MTRNLNFCLAPFALAFCFPSTSGILGSFDLVHLTQPHWGCTDRSDFWPFVVRLLPLPRNVDLLEGLRTQLGLRFEIALRGRVVSVPGLSGFSY